MAIEVKHTTQATGADAGNGEIRKAQWNEAHTINMATSKLLGRSTAGAGPAEEITLGSGLALNAGTLSATGGASSGIVWSTPITYNVTSADPASPNYWYPGFVTGGGPVYVYVSVVPTSGPSSTNYHKLMLVSPGRNVTPDILASSFYTNYKLYEASLLYGDTSNTDKVAVRLRFLSRPSDMTVSVTFGFPADNGGALTSVNSWSSSTTLPSAYTSAGIASTAYSRTTTSAGSQISVSYAATANSASSATNATFSNYTTGFQHEYGNWSVQISGSNPTNGQVLAYNSSSDRFEPTTAGGGGGVTSIVAGTGVTISSTGPNGTGAVTINASGGGGGGGGNTPPAGAVGATLSTGAQMTSGYIAYPPEFTPTGSWLFARLDAVVVTGSSSQPLYPSYPWQYNGYTTSFATSNGPMYMHWYYAQSSDFYALDSNGFFVSGLPFSSATALVFTSAGAMSPSGNAGYGISGSMFAADMGPGVEFPLLLAPPSGTFTTYDSKELVFFEFGDTLTPASGVTQSATASGPISVSLFSVPSTFVKTSPPVSPNLTYGGSWAVGVVGVPGTSYVP